MNKITFTKVLKERNGFRLLNQKLYFDVEFAAKKIFGCARQGIFDKECKVNGDYYFKCEPTGNKEYIQIEFYCNDEILFAFTYHKGERYQSKVNQIIMDIFSYLYMQEEIAKLTENL